MTNYAYSGKKRAHLKVVRKALGRSLRNTECVHHLDGDGTNNRTDNLVVCPNTEYHCLLHIRADALNSCGNANYRKCKFCKKYDDPKDMVNIDKSRPNGKYIHKVCRLQYEHERRTNGHYNSN
jgi:hypothetical protein